MTQKTVLFVGSYSNIPIGYSKISHYLTNELAEFTNLWHFGFSNFPEVKKVHRYISNKVHLIDVLELEKQKDENKNVDTFGTNVFAKVLLDIKPDIIFFYNDVIVICRLLNVIINERAKGTVFNDFKVITYLDLVYDFERLSYVKHILINSHKVLVFSDHWKQNIIKMFPSLGYDENNGIDILYHAYNENVIFNRSKTFCRQRFNLPQDSFIILNANKNVYRKALDITIESFLIFLKSMDMNKTIKLLLFCELTSSIGYDIMALIEIYCAKLSIDYETIIGNNILHIQSTSLSDDDMNILYNACDVGINTCIGEGFGMCNVEHGILGKPQIVSDVGALSDIFNETETLVPVSATFQVSNIMDEHNGEAQICSSKDFASKLSQVYVNYSYYCDIFDQFSRQSKIKYSLSNIINKVKNIID